MQNTVDWSGGLLQSAKWNVTLSTHHPVSALRPKTILPLMVLVPKVFSRQTSASPGSESVMSESVTLAASCHWPPT